MKKYQLRIELLSPTLAGSGVGFGSGIDTDVVFDDLGLPYIPAKRLKGCLRDAAEEVREMFSLAGIKADQIQIENTFGETGNESAAPVYFSNLYLENHEQTQAWLRYFLKSNDYKHLVTSDRILDTFTEIRQQTKIDDGVAFEHSLRTIRVLRKGLKFCGEVRFESDDEHILNTLLLACLNFRRFGTKRNRGLGEVSCFLLNEEGQAQSIADTLEALCTA
ncbi:MAG: RAMP superfamily CRISPR-associated protein [bacterium]